MNEVSNMKTSAEQIRAYKGPAIFSYGFRPLFLAAAGWSALAMGLWIAMLMGYPVLETAFNMIDWHVHELLYGYLSAVLAGFLLTAVPNWTGRLPITGMRLFILVLFWLAGRVAVLFADQLGPLLTALVDLSFLALLCFVIAREVIAGRNWRNLKVLIFVVFFFAGNGLFHLDAARSGFASDGYGTRLGIAVAVFLIILIGGRIVPSFTRNWLARREEGRLPITFNRFDIMSVALAGATLVLWVVVPERTETAVLGLLAGGVHLWRLIRWAGDRTLAEPLVLVLHVGYLFVPLGFIASAYAAYSPDLLPASATVHMWTAGAIGVMTIAVMTRASLGHTGQPLHATKGTVFIYVCVIMAAVLRVASGFYPATDALMHFAAILWIAAFGGFAVLYGPLLLRSQRAD